jgi:hypothetical protein
MTRHLAGTLAVCTLSGCTSLLPRSEVVSNSSWQTYQEARETFDQIVPGKTTVEDLKELQLDPDSRPNITILNYSDVLRRFLPSPSVSAADLDIGVRECIAAKTVCTGYEVQQRSIRRQRNGNFWADFTNFRRKVDVSGWQFNGLILLKDGTVVYKLTGGQPAILEHEETSNPLGPFQGIGESKLLNRF